MTVWNQLKNLSAAEEFFDLLNVAYDPAVLNVARLHILKRMGQYLRQDALAESDDDTARGLCRAHLERAYATSSNRRRSTNGCSRCLKTPSIHPPLPWCPFHR